MRKYDNMLPSRVQPIKYADASPLESWRLPSRTTVSWCKHLQRNEVCLCRKVFTHCPKYSAEKLCGFLEKKKKMKYWKLDSITAQERKKVQKQLPQSQIPVFIHYWTPGYYSKSDYIDWATTRLSFSLHSTRLYEVNSTLCAIPLAHRDDLH